ncbi:WD repeat-containing protein WDS homolog [Silene latifolia]|uniref:WD repeat-containing protein WDS homolog n=1 Tax=Silene latifolia TaxID=37657 RepID=UPI003D77BE14
MGILECRSRESCLKRRKFYSESMTMGNDSCCTVLGQKGLIKKHEFVRVLIQCLYSLGLYKSASCLESESGIAYKSKEFEVIESEIINAKWEECIKSLHGINGLTDEMRCSTLYLVIKQYLFECLSNGDDSTALAILQKRVSSLKMGTEKVHRLACNMLVYNGKGVGEMSDNVVELRKKLLVELEKLLPSPVTLPERRLEHLVESALSSQIDSCLYHNSIGPVSLYEDHCCGRDQIPTETVQILTAHQNEVWFVQFSNGGKYLASSSSDCTAIIWKVVPNGEFTVKHTLESHQNPVSFVSWSPDDTMLLTCGNVEVVKLWDVETGTCKRTFGDHGFIVSSCAWFPDSKRLVCGSSEQEKGIYMWDHDGNELRVWRGTRMPKVLDLAVTSDGNNLISVFSDKDIRILNVVTNSENVISEEHPITSLSVSADGKFFIVNLNSQEIHLWDVAGKWKKPLKYTGHMQNKYVIRSCFGGFNSAFIASGSENSEVYIWNRQKSEPIEVLSGHSMTVNCVSWNPGNPQMLASASDDHTVRIWGPAKSISK